MPIFDPKQYLGYQLATVDEVIAGIDDNTIVSPYTLIQALQGGVDFVIDDLTVNGDLTLAGSTDGGFLLGGGASSPVRSTARPTNGQLPIGSTGADPVPASLASSLNSILFNAGAGSLNLDVNGWEAGTFTTTISTATTPITTSYQNQVGMYFKIRNRVWFRALVRLDTISVAGTGPVRLEGLPYQSPTDYGTGADVVLEWQDMNLGSSTQSGARVPSGNVTYVVIQYYNATGAPTAWDGSELTNGCRVSCTGFYRINT